MEEEGVEEELPVVDAEVGFDVAAAEGLAVEEGFAPLLDDPITQFPFWQLKPFGQQALPHFCNAPERSVLCSWLSGVKVAFCFDVSQLIGLMVLQLSPLGQHIADLLSLKAMHCWSEGQQKFEGRLFLLHGF